MPLNAKNYDPALMLGAQIPDANFNGYTGPTGPTGATGPAGATGPTGPTA